MVRSQGLEGEALRSNEMDQQGGGEANPTSHPNSLGEWRSVGKGAIKREDENETRTK